MRRRVESWSAIGRTFREASPERAHRRPKRHVRLRHGVCDKAGELGHVRKLELERRALGKERAQLFQVGLGHVRGRDPGVEQS